MEATKEERKAWDSIMREKRKLTKIGESLKASIGEVDEESWGDQTVRISHYDHILCVFEVIDHRMVYRFWLVDWLDTINEPCSHYRGEVSIPDSIMGKTHKPFHDEFVRICRELGLTMVHDEGFVIVYSNEPTQSSEKEPDAE